MTINPALRRLGCGQRSDRRRDRTQRPGAVEDLPAPRLPAEPVRRGLLVPLPVPPVALRPQGDQAGRPAVRPGRPLDGPVRDLGRRRRRADDRHVPRHARAAADRARPAGRRAAARPRAAAAADASDVREPAAGAAAPRSTREPGAQRYEAEVAGGARAGRHRLARAGRPGPRRDRRPPPRAVARSGGRRARLRRPLDVHRRRNRRPAGPAGLAGLPARDAADCRRRRRRGRGRDRRAAGPGAATSPVAAGPSPSPSRSPAR